METLSLRDIEHIHDVLVVALMPFDERVSPSENRDRGMIASALGRPFQSAFGEEAFQTPAAKAAALFHSLVCNHCFLNGNKRTAVIATDIFLGINGCLLSMSPAELYSIAVETAQANAVGRRMDEVLADLTEKIAANTTDIRQVDHTDLKADVLLKLFEGGIRVLGYASLTATR